MEAKPFGKSFCGLDATVHGGIPSRLCESRQVGYKIGLFWLVVFLELGKDLLEMGFILVSFRMLSELQGKIINS